MILIVTYDLKTAGDYTPFYNALKAQGTWWHYIASTWLISTQKSPDEVSTALRPFLYSQDFLLVAEMGERYQGYLPPQAWDWITNQRKLEADQQRTPWGGPTGALKQPPAQRSAYNDTNTSPKTREPRKTASASSSLAQEVIDHSAFPNSKKAPHLTKFGKRIAGARNTAKTGICV